LIIGIASAQNRFAGYKDVSVRPDTYIKNQDFRKPFLVLQRV
jgi:hypothetical protein